MPVRAEKNIARNLKATHASEIQTQPNHNNMPSFSTPRRSSKSPRRSSKSPRRTPKSTKKRRTPKSKKRTPKGHVRTTGSRVQVMHGTAKKTNGGLTKSDLKVNKWGEIVSRKKSEEGARRFAINKDGIRSLFRENRASPFRPKRRSSTPKRATPSPKRRVTRSSTRRAASPFRSFSGFF